MVSPNRLSHVVLQTNKLAAMRDWYCLVLGARPAFDNGQVAFLAYDEEHHRIGLIGLGDYAEPTEPVVGLQHFSFCYDTLGLLFGNYERLRDEGITPAWSLNHGATISLYYADPDGNRIELQVDVFATAEEVDAFINSPVYQNNPRGVEFKPEEKLAQLRAGASFAELTALGGPA